MMITSRKQSNENIFVCGKRGKHHLMIFFENTMYLFAPKEKDWNKKPTQFLFFFFFPWFFSFQDLRVPRTEMAALLSETIPKNTKKNKKQTNKTKQNKRNKPWGLVLFFSFLFFMTDPKKFFQLTVPDSYFSSRDDVVNIMVPWSGNALLLKTCELSMGLTHSS